MGDKAAAQAAIQKLVDRTAKNRVGTFEVAAVYAGLGENGRACEWLERAYKVHDSEMCYLKSDPRLDPPLRPALPGPAAPHELSAVSTGRAAGIFQIRRSTRAFSRDLRLG